MTPREDLAYAAGIIDGEGTIYISELPPAPPRRVSPQFRMNVAVVMCDYEVPEWLDETFGGGVRYYDGRKRTHTAQAHWSLGAGRAAEFLRDILPYLKAKKEQAKLAIEFYEKHFASVVNPRSKKVPDAMIADRRVYRERMQLLNARGGD